MYISSTHTHVHSAVYTRTSAVAPRSSSLSLISSASARGSECRKVQGREGKEVTGEHRASRTPLLLQMEAPGEAEIEIDA